MTGGKSLRAQTCRANIPPSNRTSFLKDREVYVYDWRPYLECMAPFGICPSYRDKLGNKVLVCLACEVPQAVHAHAFWMIMHDFSGLVADGVYTTTASKRSTVGQLSVHVRCKACVKLHNAARKDSKMTLDQLFPHQLQQQMMVVWG